MCVRKWENCERSCANFFLFTIKKIKHLNNHTHDTHLHYSYKHTCDMHEHTHTCTFTNTHTHTHTRLTHACVIIHTVIYQFHLQQNARNFFFNFWHYWPAKITILPRKLREAQNNVEICMDFFSNKKFILSNWTSIVQTSIEFSFFITCLIAKVREKRERGEKKDIRIRYM